MDWSTVNTVAGTLHRLGDTGDIYVSTPDMNINAGEMKYDTYKPGAAHLFTRTNGSRWDAIPVDTFEDAKMLAEMLLATNQEN